MHFRFFYKLGLRKPRSGETAVEADLSTAPIGLAYGGLFIVMMVWGMVPVFLKKLLAVFSPTELSFTRFLLSGGVLLLWLALAKFAELKRIFLDDLKLLVLAAVFGPLTAMVCFNYAIIHITIGTAAAFAALEPLCTYIMAVLIGQEIWKPGRMMSIVFALGGMALVVLSRETWGAAYWISVLLVTLSPIIWAVNNIITKELVKRHSAPVMTASSFVLSALFLIPTLSGKYWSAFLSMTPSLWLALFYCVASTIFGFTIWYWSLKFLPPSTVAVSMYVIPVFSVASGMILLNEPMSLMKGSGIAVVLLGLYLVNVRFR